MRVLVEQLRNLLLHSSTLQIHLEGVTLVKYFQTNDVFLLPVLTTGRGESGSSSSTISGCFLDLGPFGLMISCFSSRCLRRMAVDFMSNFSRHPLTVHLHLFPLNLEKCFQMENAFGAFFLAMDDRVARTPSVRPQVLKKINIK